MTENLVDLREVKSVARQVLPRGHPVREALDREPDVLEGPEARARLVAYCRILLAQREGKG